MKTWNVVCVSWRISSRNLILWLLLMIYFIYLYLGINYYTTGQDYSPGDALLKMSFLIQGGILAFILIGIIFVRVEENHNLNEVFNTIHNGMFLKTVGKLVFGIIFIFVLVTTSYLLFAFMLYTTGTDLSVFYWSAYKHVILYWGLTFFISLLIGSLLAYIIKGKFVYPLALFIWAFIGPANKFLLGDTANQLHAQKILYFLNLGEPNPYAPFDAFYGFALSDFHWIKKLVFALSILFIFCITFFIKNYLSRKIIVTLIVTTLLLIPSIYYLNLDKQIYISASSGINESREKYDYQHYAKSTDELFIKDKQSEVMINKYYIDLKVNRLMNVTAKMLVTNRDQQPLKEIRMGLYHEFKIKRISVNNKNVSFEQEQDFFTIKLKDVLGVGEKLSIQVTYKGTSSPNFFATEQAIFLPYYYPWLPSTILKPAFEVSKSGELLRVNHQPEQPTKYTLNYDGSQKLYTNLSKVSKHKWQGEDLTGITIVSGELGKSKIKSDTLIQPNSWSSISKKDYILFNERTLDLINNITRKLGIDNLDYPDKILYLPILSISDNQSSQRFWYSNNHIIYGTNLAYQDALLPDTKFAFTYWAVPALTWKHLSIDNSLFASFFSDAYSYVYNKQMKIPDEGVLLPINISGSEQKTEAISLITDWIKKSTDYEKMNKFFNEWFQLVKKEDENWGKLLNLIKQYTQEVE